MRRVLTLSAKIAVSILLLWWAQSRFTAAEALSIDGDVAPAMLAAALAVQVVLTLPLTLRWLLAARALGKRIQPRVAWRLVWVGQFFNQTLPSTLGGDAYRIWALSARYDHTIGFASMSVVLDRLLALLAVPLIALSGVWLVPEFMGNATVATIVWPVSGAICLGTLVLARLDAIPSGLRRHAPSVFERLERFSVALRRAVRRQNIAASGLVLSVAIHGATALSVFLARAVGLKAELLHFLVVTPIVMFIAMLPVTISGWGLREGAMMMAFGALGYDPGLVFATSVAFGLMMIVVGLPGGLLWIVHHGSRRSERHGMGAPTTPLATCPSTAGQELDPDTANACPKAMS